MFSNHVLNLTSIILLIVGGFNWGLVAIFGFDPLAPILGGYDSIITRIFYGVVGLASIWAFYGYLMTPGEDLIKEED
jgi:uncharacterized protein